MRPVAAESVDASVMLILDVYIYMHRVVSCREIRSVVWPVVRPSRVSNTQSVCTGRLYINVNIGEFEQYN